MLKKNGNKNYNDNMKNLSNYSFGGVSPLKIMKTSQSLAHVGNQSIQRPKSAIVTEQIAKSDKFRKRKFDQSDNYVLNNDSTNKKSIFTKQ